MTKSRLVTIVIISIIIISAIYIREFNYVGGPNIIVEYYGNINNNRSYLVDVDNIKYKAILTEVNLGENINIDTKNIMIVELNSIREKQDVINYFSGLLNKNVPIVFYGDKITRKDIEALFKTGDIQFKNEYSSANNDSTTYAIYVKKLLNPMGNGSHYFLANMNYGNGVSNSSKIKDIIIYSIGTNIK